MNSVILFVSAIVLLIVSSVLGFMSMPTEMGLAILSGALGMAFSNIDKISEFKGAGFEAKIKGQIQAVIDKETETEVEEIKSDELPQVASVPENAKKIIVALQHQKYTWRSISGLTRDTGLTRKDLLNNMGWLVTSRYVKHSMGKPGSIWTLTNKGRQLSAVIDYVDSK